MRVGLSLMLEDDFRLAVQPLLAAGAVGVLEWSFDVCWDVDRRAPWAAALLDWFAERGALLGHGVTFSLLSALFEERQAGWLARLERESARRRYAHVSEHFGFLTAGGSIDGAPLPLPLTPAALRIGRDRLQRIADAAQRPVGLENLAFAFGRDDVQRQGEFLDALLAPSDGFLLLDLHNLHCQAHNFDLPADELLASYPLERVRELHVSGGSWSTTGDGGRVRRDTHDGAVPDDVFALVAETVRRCPRAEAVILERLGGTLDEATDHAQLRADYERLANLVAEVSDAR
jgi:uncharacterized protein (UPF0276 family)